MIKNISQDFLFKSVAILIFPLAILSPVSVWILAIIPAIFLVFIRKNWNTFFNLDIIEKLFILFILFSSISLIWSIEVKYGFTVIASISILFLSFIIMKKSTLKLHNEKIKRVLTTSYLIVLYFTLVDIFFALGIKPWLGSIFDYLVLDNAEKPTDYFTYFTNFEKGSLSGSYNRGLAVINIFFFIVAGCNYKNRFLLLILYLSTFFILMVGENLSAFLSFVFGSFVFVLFYILKKWIFFPLISVILFYALCAPIIFNKYDINTWAVKEKALSSSIERLHDLGYSTTKNLDYLLHKGQYIRYRIEYKLLHRFFIWSVSSNKTMKKIILGHGVSSSRKFGEKETVEFKRITGDNIEKIYYPSIPLHTHNNTVQIWLELGLVGIILFYSFFTFFWYKILFRYKLKKFEYSLASGCLFSVFLINQTSYGLWQSWWISAILLCVIFFIILFKNEEKSETLV